MGRPDWSSWFVLLAILGCSPLPLPAASALSFRSLLGTRSLAKRALPVDGDGLEIPLYKDSLGRYVASISMGNQEKVGATIQNFSFVLSTSSPYTAVAGAKCAACISEVGSSSLYNDTISQTEVPLNNTQSLVIGDNQVKGDTISEACAFVQRNGSLWWYPDQTVMVASESQNFFANGAAGLIGLGRSSGKDSFIDTVFRDHAGWNTLLIGLAFEDVPATTSSDPTGGKAAGVINLRRTDDSLYDGDIKYSQVVKPTSQEATAAGTPSNYPSDWSLKLDSWTVNAGSTKTQYTSGGIAIVEPYFPEIRLPQQEAVLFYRDVNGATMMNTTDGPTWTLPCKPDVSLDVVFSGTKFTVESRYLVEGDTSQERCTGVVRGWDNPFVSSYMLGAAFAQTVYIAYNATRDGNDTIGFAPRPGSNTLRDSRMNAGAVAGISVGATVGFFLCLLLFYLWWRAKRAVRVINYTEKDGGSKSGIEPYTPLTATSPAFKPMGSPGLYSATTPGFSATSPGFTLSPSGNGHSSEQDRHQYVIEQGPIGGDVVGVAASVPSSVTPESSPRSTMLPPAHRRKAEEAGLLAPTSFTAAALAARRGNRPPSQGESVSNVTSTDYLHNLVSPGGVTTSTGLMGQGGGALPSTPGSQIYHPGDAIPQTQSTQQHVTHQSSAEPLLVRNGTPANASVTVSTPPPTSSATPAPSSMDTRHQSTATNLMSPTSPHQIHYHIHIAPGASATSFPLPPGSIIHEYNADEPAPEYSERPGSMSMSMEGVETHTHTHTHVTTPPHTGTSTHFAS